MLLSAFFLFAGEVFVYQFFFLFAVKSHKRTAAARTVHCIRSGKGCMLAIKVTKFHEFLPD